MNHLSCDPDQGSDERPGNRSAIPTPPVNVRRPHAMQMRSWAYWLFACLAVVALAGLPTVAAADDGDTCTKQSGDLAIAACSRAIGSGRYTGRSLAADYVKRGREYQAKDDLDRAIADFSEAIRLDPKYAVAYDNRGVAWVLKGENDRAMADFDEAIRLDPKGAIHYGNRGIVWKRKGDLDRAIADYNEAIRFAPNYAKPYYNRGVAWGLKGDLDRAIAEYNEAIRLDPKYAPAYLARGTVWEIKHGLQEALADFKMYSQLAPSDPKGSKALERVMKALSAR